MEERFRGRALWIGLAVLAVIGLCGLLGLLAAGGAAISLLRPAQVAVVPPVAVQPPVAESGGQPGVVQPPAHYPYRYHGPFGFVFGALRCLLPLALLAFFVALIVRRRRCCHGWAWAGPHGPPHPPSPPGAEGDWPRGPWGWHPRHWGPPPPEPPAGPAPAPPGPRPGEQD